MPGEEFVDILDEGEDEWLALEGRVAGRLPQKNPFESSLQEAGRVRRELATKRSAEIYQRPLPSRARPSLATRLERAPTTVLVHPFENQVSEILGFIIDHDHRFACDLVELLWSSSGVGQYFWPHEPRSIGAFPGGTLPGAGLAPVLYPDISICGADPDFQILVEVKVTADFHGYPDEDGHLLLQPDAYVLGWASVAEGLAPERRRVSSIAPAAPARAESPHPMRGRDITWQKDVIPLLLECALRRGPLDDYLGVTALDLATAVTSRLAPPPRADRPGTSRELSRLLVDWHEPLVEALGLLEQSRAGEVRPGKVAVASDYLGAYLSVDTVHHDTPARIWVFLTTSDGNYNRTGQPASACVCLWEPGPVKSPALHGSLRGPLAAADARRADRAQETAARVYRPLSSFDAETMRGPQLALWAEGVLIDSGLLGPTEA